MFALNTAALTGSLACAGINAAAISSPVVEDVAGHETVMIPKGATVIGGMTQDSRPTWISFKRDVFIGRTPVTRGQFHEVIEEGKGFLRSPEKVVTHVSVHEAEKYLRIAGERLNGRGNPLRLPTEAEWENAMQGGAVNLVERMEDEWGQYNPLYFRDFVEGRFGKFVFDVMGQIFTNPDGELFQALLKRCMAVYGWRLFDTRSGRREEAVSHDEQVASPFGISATAGYLGEWTADDYCDMPLSPDVDPLCSQIALRRSVRGDFLGAGTILGHRSPLETSAKHQRIGFRVAMPAG